MGAIDDTHRKDQFEELKALYPEKFIREERIFQRGYGVKSLRPVAQTTCFIGLHNEGLLVVIALAGDNGFCYVLSFSGYTNQMLL